MNESTLVLDESHVTATSTEKEPNATEYDARVAGDETPRAYKALPGRAARPNFMDFFAPRRRQSTDESVPRYTALAEPPADSSEILSEILDEVAVTPEILEASTDQSTEQPASHGKAPTKPVTAERTHHGAD